MIFTSFKGRSVHEGQKVRVYRNLHKQGIVYSVQDPRTGLVLGYSEEILLSNVTFKVSEYGRARVLRTKKKNVHAFVEGTLRGFQIADLSFSEFMQMEKVAYNPYKYTTFVHKETETPVHNAVTALIDNHGILALELS